jgi:flagellar biosynthesis anti-sigma factor FlgM
MTNPVSSYSPGQALSDPIGSASAAPNAASSSTSPSGSPPDAPVSSGEAVTLTSDAKTSTDLLQAAREAAGIDLQAVQSLKAQIIAGTYQIPPAKLAASIIAALAETQS